MNSLRSVAKRIAPLFVKIILFVYTRSEITNYIYWWFLSRYSSARKTTFAQRIFFLLESNSQKRKKLRHVHERPEDSACLGCSVLPFSGNVTKAHLESPAAVAR